MKNIDRIILQQMIDLYKGSDIEKKNLVVYSLDKLENCPFNSTEKPRCVKCKIHCYDKIHQEQIKKVMRQTRIKFALLHPALTARYFMRI